MSFFNESSACQASANPLSKVINTTTNERNNFGSLNNTQNDQLQHSSNSKIHNFQNIDTSIQNDFNNFTTVNHLNNDFISNTFEPNVLQQQQQHMNMQMQIQNSQLQNQHNNWASDFKSFTSPEINNIMLQQTNQPQQQNQHQHQHQQHIPLHQNTFRVQSNYTQAYNIPGQLYQTRQQQQEIHTQKSSTSLKELNDSFDNVFNELDTDLSNANQAQQAKEEEEENKNVKNDEEDKIKFAILAQNVFNIMNNTPKNVSSSTSAKFKQSGFMQMMNKISNREIEISNDKTKLVDQNGSDIRSDLSNPLANMKINDVLESPYDSAIKVSQNTTVKVDTNSWQGDFS